MIVITQADLKLEGVSDQSKIKLNDSNVISYDGIVLGIYKNKVNAEAYVNTMKLLMDNGFKWHIMPKKG